MLAQALAGLPEWHSQTPEQMNAFAEKLTKVEDEKVIPFILQHAAELLGEHRAGARLEEHVKQEVEKRTEAMRQEIAALRMRLSDAPDLTRPKGLPTATNIPGMSDEEFTRYWKENHLKQ